MGINFTDWLISYVFFTAIIILRYFALVGPIHWLLWHRPAHKTRAQRLSKHTPGWPIIRHEIKLSTLSAFIYAAPAALVIELWKADGTALYSGTVTSFGSWLYVGVSCCIYLAIQDTYFYWTHRLMHHKVLFRYFHLGHHRSVQPTPWASFSFDPPEALISAWLLPALTLIIPLHIGAALGLLIFMTITAIFNHAGWEVLPKRWIKGWFGRVFITATHHNRHHTRPRSNFGLYFRFWDKLIKTDSGLG